MRILSPIPLLTLCLASHLRAAGELDNSFNPNVNGEIKALAVAPDGKIVIGGPFFSVGNSSRVGLARLLANGQVDTSWAPPSKNPVAACAVLEDGSVIVGASLSGHEGICRVRPDGTIDPRYTASVTGGEIRAMSVDADGNLLVAGNFTTVNGTKRGGFAVLGTDGIAKGKYYAEPGQGKSVNSLLPRPDRSTLLGGDFSPPTTNISYLAKMTSGALLDGKFYPPFTVADGKSVNCLALQNSEILRPIVGGNFSTQLVGGVPENRCLARLSSTGTWDTTFNPVFTNLNGVPKVTSVVVQTDGAMIVAGDFTAVNGKSRQSLVRLTQSGSVDDSFTASAAGATGLAIQADGKLLVTGNFQQVNGATRKYIARLLNVDPGRESLTIREDRITWQRIGQESEFVSFEVSSDGGATWQMVKAPSRLGSRSSWTSAGEGPIVPASGILRARARLSSGIMNGSSGIAEKLMSYTLIPNISVSAERVSGGWSTLVDGATPVDYGDLDQGSPQERSFQIFNSGTFGLTVTGIQLPPGFSLVNPPVFPRRVNSLGVLSFSIRADASSLGAIGGTAMISSDDPDTPAFDIPLTSVVNGPDIAMKLGEVELQSGGTEPVSFAPGYQGTLLLPKILTISNPGNRDLEVSAITAGVGFTVDVAVPFTLPPGESHAFQVGPDQSIAGALTSNLEVYSNDSDEPVFRVPLAAQVLNPLVTKVVNPRTILNHKTGLREQMIRIINPVKTARVGGFRVIVRGLPEWVQVRNASEILPDGSVVIEVHRPLGPSGRFTLMLEYEIPKGSPAKVLPALTTEVILNVPKAAAAATLAVEKCERDCEGHFAVTFRSVPGRLYQVEYSADGKVWKPTSTPTRAAGSIVRWLDCGCPQTECAPKDAPMRFYRVRELE